MYMDQVTMGREGLEHAIRAASLVSGEDQIVVIGSHAILGQHPFAPSSLLRGRTIDLFPRDRPERGDLIDGSFGEGSYFEEVFGLRLRAARPDSAEAPSGWQSRLVPVRSETTGGATGWCMEAHDLVLAKCVAGRTRDWEFTREALAHDLVDPMELFARITSLPVSAGQRRMIWATLQNGS
jgi:hypothetical protein